MVMKKKTNTASGKEYSLSITRATRTIYFFLALYSVSIIVFDAGNLLTREIIIERWTLATMVLVINTLVWYAAARKKQDMHIQFYLTVLLAAALLGFAGYMTYLERGMASTSTILYALPLLVIALNKNRHALLAITVLSVGTYAYAAVRYFNEFFNEGYRIQLWGTILLVSACIFTCSWLIMNIAGLRHDSV